MNSWIYLGVAAYLAAGLAFTLLDLHLSKPGQKSWYGELIELLLLPSMVIWAYLAFILLLVGLLMFDWLDCRAISRLSSKGGIADG